MKTDRLLLAVSLFFLVSTLFLSALSFHMTDLGIRLETILYASYMFISGIGTLILIEVIHLAKGEISQHHSARTKLLTENDK